MNVAYYQDKHMNREHRFYCDFCQTSWPCDARELADQLYLLAGTASGFVEEPRDVPLSGGRTVTEQFDVIVSDPPWAYYGQQNKWGSASKFYNTMGLDDIVSTGNLPDLLADNGILFLWATSPLLDVAMEAINKWGLTFRGVAFVWVKTKKTDPTIPVGAQGVRPSIVKPTTEFVLSASRVKKGRPMKLYSESVRQVILAPKREHSRKPDQLFENIDAMYPGARKLEMYSREVRPGWEQWGNQIGMFGKEEL